FGKFMDRPLGALCLQIPKRAIKRIARRARWHCCLQALAIYARSKLRPHHFDLRPDAVHALAIPRIGDALAAATCNPVAEFGNNGYCFGFTASADGKGAGDGPALNCKRKGQRQAHRAIRKSSGKTTISPSEIFGERRVSRIALPRAQAWCKPCRFPR